MSIDFEKNSRIAELFDVYGNLLAEKQQVYMRKYYLYDLSLSEIAAERNISRASVLDTLKQATKKLEEFEENLHVLHNKNIISDIKNKKLKKQEILDELERIK